MTIRWKRTAGAVAAAGILTLMAPVPAAQAAPAYGTPNKCTHSVSKNAYGWAGYRYASFRGAKWVGGVHGYHRHKVLMTQISYLGNQYDKKITWTIYVGCQS